jgi:dTDP-4-dehydrorhamnose reductase
MPRLLVTGASGFVGSKVVAFARAKGLDVHGTQGTPDGSWPRLDISDRQATLDHLAAVGPDVIVHTAAGRNPHDWAVIADGSAHVASAARRVGARLVHVSTDAVFGGDRGPYDENALPAPVNLYGSAKAAAETAVKETALIVRISLVIGGGNHEQVVHQGRPHYTNALRSPIHVEDLARALVELAESDLAGVVHLQGADDVSRYELARLIATRDGLDPDTVPPAEAATPYPLDTRLRSTRWPQLPGAREFLRPGA